MVKITYTVQPEKSGNVYILDVIGHAASAPAGEDLVCAGASTLTTALATTLAEHSDWLILRNISLKEGNSRIKIIPKKKDEYKVRLIFGTILNGFQLLHQSFPDYIQLNS